VDGAGGILEVPPQAAALLHPPLHGDHMMDEVENIPDSAVCGAGCTEPCVAIVNPVTRQTDTQVFLHSEHTVSLSPDIRRTTTAS
jgi:hypothetical protein